MSKPEVNLKEPWMKNVNSGRVNWGNLAYNGSPGKPVSYKASTYLPEADEWAKKQKSLNEESSSQRFESLSKSNMENIDRDKRSYDRYLERMGLPPRANKTPPRRRQPVRRYVSRRSRSPSRRSRGRSRSPSRSRSSGRKGKHRRSSSRRRSPRRPSVNEFGRNLTRNYRRKPSPVTRRRPSPRRYTVAENGRTVDEFGRNIPRGPPPKKAVGTRFFNEKTRKYKRPIHVFNNVTRTYKPADWNV